MVTKPKKQSTTAKKGRAKVRKLKVNKETVRNLSENEVKNVKGGLIPSVGVGARPGIYEIDVKTAKGGIVPSLGVK
jgi:hypothetical protein